jgi:hypothetical protein
MVAMKNRILCGLAVWAGVSVIVMPAYALDGPAPVQIDGGPLGPLEISAGLDGYLFAQSGASKDAGTSVVGGQSTGAVLDAWMIEIDKATGLLQFTLQAAEFQNINLGTNKPQDVNNDRFTTGPIRSAYATLAVTPNLKLSAGQFPSLEGYESVFAWKNPVGLRTVIAGVENSNSRGFQLDYTNGPFSGTVLFSDGYDTGVLNYLQVSATDNINAHNNFTIFAGIPLGTTGPNTFAYGSGGLPSGGANGNGGQGQLANVNSNTVGAWYTWMNGGLSITPEVQVQYTRAITKYADVVSGGVSDDIPKGTGNFAAALFGDYKFGASPYSLAAWAEYGTSHGSAAQDAWFVAPNAELVGFAVAPTWQHKYLFARLNLGYVHLLDRGTPPAGFGNNGDERDQVTSTLEFGFVY